MTTTANELQTKGDAARRAARNLARTATDGKNRAPEATADALGDHDDAIIAANDSDIIRFGKDTYSYMWGRDGAFVAVALAEAGYSHACMKYFEFCARALSDEGFLFQHYNPDGSLASNWHAWLIDGKEVRPTSWTPFTMVCNLTGQPAATVPCGFTSEGLPVGLHVIARAFREKTILTAAQAYANARPWADRWPQGAEPGASG